MMDTSAEAVLDGNKFFQRHAAVLGSTGSGKSWCVANILEKASKLKYTNIIVFDMHGEYKSLTRGQMQLHNLLRLQVLGIWKRRTTMLCSCHIGYLTEKNSYQ